MLLPYLQDWLEVPTTPFSTPLGSIESFLKCLYSTIGDPSPNVIAALEKSHGLNYRKVIGELIWPMTTVDQILHKQQFNVHRPVLLLLMYTSVQFKASSVSLLQYQLMVFISGKRNQSCHSPSTQCQLFLQAHHMISCSTMTRSMI
jgi:hypothetical protein